MSNKGPTTIVFEAPTNEGAYKRAAIVGTDIRSPALRLVRRIEVPKVEGCSTSRFVLAAIFIASVVGAFIVLDERLVADVLDWITESSIQGAVLFVVLYMMAIVLVVPGTLLALCAGAMFNWHVGTLLVWIGQSCGQVLAFLIGRYLLRDAVVHNVMTRYKKFAAIDAALEREGWRLVVMLRLSPVVPWNILNYLLSITGVSLISYTIGSCIAVLPWLSLFCYVGSMASTAADVLSGQVGPNSQMRLMVAAASGVLLISAVVYTGAVAKRAISEAFAGNNIDETQEDVDVESPVQPTTPRGNRANAAAVEMT